MIGLKEIFPANTLEQWVELLKKDLKSEDLHELHFNEKLEGISFKSYNHSDLIDVAPISPGQFPYTRGLNTLSNNWKNGFYIRVDNIQEANKKALQLLMQGVDSLIFELNESILELDVLLDGIGLEYIHTTFIPQTFDQVSSILNGPCSEHKSVISIAIDLNKTNGLKTELSELVNLLKKDQVPVFMADGYQIQQCGANITQELAFILSTGNEYLNILLNEGLTIDEAAACIHFRVGLGSDYFHEIAKIRALRTLWANIIKQYDPKHSCSYNCQITAQTGSMNKSAKDPNTNLLRQTTEAMSAIMGGIDQLVVLPFDYHSSNGSSNLSERMAVNISLILKEESYLHTVIDPAGGSYTIEDLTNKICINSWEKFQSLDEKGGIFNSNCSNYLVEEVKKTAVERIEQIRNKEKTLIGVNKFSNPTPEDNSFGEYGSYLGLNMINFERDI